jgi:enoyl-CoA hydratase
MKMVIEIPKAEPSEYWNKVMADVADDVPEPWLSPNSVPHVRIWTKKFIKFEVDKENKIGYVILNRPAKLNAGCPYAASEACAIAKDDPDVKAIVIKANGRAFCAGYDITPRPPSPDPEKTRVERYMMEPRNHAMNEVYRTRIWENPKPIIGSVHGFVTAGGLHMLSHADMVIASEDAVFGYPILRRGSALGPKAVWWYLWGIRKAKEMLFTGCYVSAQEAYVKGYLNKVVPREKLEEETFILAKAVATLPSHRVATSKRIINDYFDGQLGWRAFLSTAEIISGMTHEYDGSPTEYGTPAWNREMQKKGLSYLLRQRDKPFEDMDRWWREKLAARPKFETGRLEKDWAKIAEEQKKKAEELAKVE